MAILVGNSGLGCEEFRIAPIRAIEFGQDATVYSLDLITRSKDNLHRHFSVKGWQMQHDDVWVIARTFAEAPKLLESRLEVDLWRTGRAQAADIFESCCWLEVALHGIPRQRVIRVVLFIQEDPLASLYSRHFMSVRVEDAEDFGLQLEREIVEASPVWASERHLPVG